MRFFIGNKYLSFPSIATFALKRFQMSSTNCLGFFCRAIRNQALEMKLKDYHL